MYSVNDRICTTENNYGTVRYVGPLPVWGSEVIAIGVEWDDPSLGKHSGTLEGVRYFETSVSNSGTFLKSTSKKICRERNTFVEALIGSYGHAYHQLSVTFGSKKVEDYGFKELSSTQQQYATLRSVSLDKKNITGCGGDNHDGSDILGLLASVISLDLSYNLLSSTKELWDILRHMPLVEEVNLNGNRFTVFSRSDSGDGKSVAYPRTKSLKLAGTHISLDELRSYILPAFPNLEELVLAGNGYSEWDIVVDVKSLRHVDVSFNSLSVIPSIDVECLNLANNRIRIKGSPLVLSPRCTQVDLRYNDISHWEDVDVLGDRFPSLKRLRINGNPLFDDILVEDMTLNVVARVGGLLSVNGSIVDAEETLNAELFFVSKVINGDYCFNRASKRWTQLIEKHGIKQESSSSSSSTTPTHHSCITIGLNIKHTDGTIALERKMLKSHTILRVKGILSEKLSMSLLDMILFYYIDDDESSTRRVLDDNFATVDNYGFKEGQTIYVAINHN
ncbi:uncharacterized protein KQ657_002803 [Scheffersomyces spartinae]|uniref:CAP-Gly domain-containing protein n=1 Tax=Scheffersomyces spartinae TaxID=45513 RepID=A0A9P7V617_9ASCO|nr:uncharacterized protein KQ657_002803 [Scheffersomyces spartinae]KAG7191835.1 hypothetical protein KQ657_002803 [Scheffersomyces spartinae]